MSPATLYPLLSAALGCGLAACAIVAFTRAAGAIRRAVHAEVACEELRKALMAGSTVGTWHWRAGERPPAADEFYLHVKTGCGDLLLTREAFAEALERARKLRPPT